MQTLLRSSADVTADDTTVETDLLHMVLVGGTIGPDQGLMFWLGGDLVNPTFQERSFTFRVRLGGVLVFTTILPMSPADPTVHGWTLTGEMFRDAVAAAVDAATTFLEGGVDSGGGVSGAANLVYLATLAGGGIDLSMDQTLRVTVQPSVAAAGLRCTRRSVFVESIP